VQYGRTYEVVDEAGIRQRYQVLAGVVDERVRRLMVAAESLAIGRGGQVAVAHATGVSRTTIQQGTTSATACRPIRKHWKAANIQTATLSLNT
jgi:hypothetical protein